MTLEHSQRGALSTDRKAFHSRPLQQPLQTQRVTL